MAHQTFRLFSPFHYLSRDHHNAHKLTKRIWIHRLNPVCGRRAPPESGCTGGVELSCTIMKTITIMTIINTLRAVTCFQQRTECTDVLG